ncbi:helix-turn-helix domain-containing protein [Cupriavidus oxalaticus]|uniref:helix-turn-helix domain-containing protein n=1 Tax=Cupriavidus oxalaticus TaxID=96344 RepID=UPI0012441574|nr:helix-turn-helix domain-containing protein [Cupriavidus oxalaticus]
MAHGLFPLVARLAIDAAMRNALVSICDLARERPDGQFVAKVSGLALAAMLGVSENYAHRVMAKLSAAGWISRGARQSEWVVNMKSRKAINSALADRWKALGGASGGAPIVSKKWEVRRREYPERGNERRTNNGKTISGFRTKKQHKCADYSDEKTAQDARINSTSVLFPKRPYIRFTQETRKQSVHDATTAPTETRPPKTRKKPGGSIQPEPRLAEKGSPDASQKDAAPDGVMPEPGGMVG